MAAEKETTPANLTGTLAEFLNRKHRYTPSEMLVHTAKDRDILYDIIRHAKDELDDSEMDDETRKFHEDYIAALSGAKDILTACIQSLLSKT